MNVFDIIGPIMIGPSSSHTAGAVRIGLMSRLLLGEPAVKAYIRLHGSFAQTYKGHGTDRALAAGIMGMQTDDERIRNSLKIAKESGLDITFEPTVIPDAHPNTAEITLTAADGRTVCVQGATAIMTLQVDGRSLDENLQTAIEKIPGVTKVIFIRPF